MKTAPPASGTRLRWSDRSIETDVCTYPVLWLLVSKLRPPQAIRDTHAAFRQRRSFLHLGEHARTSACSSTGTIAQAWTRREAVLRMSTLRLLYSWGPHSEWERRPKRSSHVSVASLPEPQSRSLQTRWMGEKGFEPSVAQEVSNSR